MYITQHMQLRVRDFFFFYCMLVILTELPCHSIAHIFTPDALILVL